MKMKSLHMAWTDRNFIFLKILFLTIVSINKYSELNFVMFCVHYFRAEKETLTISEDIYLMTREAVSIISGTLV